MDFLERFLRASLRRSPTWLTTQYAIGWFIGAIGAAGIVLGVRWEELFFVGVGALNLIGGVALGFGALVTRLAQLSGTWSTS